MEDKEANELQESKEALLKEQQKWLELSTECDELSAVADQICDGITSAAAANQLQPSDDVAMATPRAPPPTPAALDSADTTDGIQQKCQELSTECDELSAVADQTCDEITSAAATNQSQPSDDVAMATPRAPPPTPAALDNADTTDVIPTSPPDDVIDGNGTVITPEEMNLAELKVRVVCLEKESMALRMELKCAELQVAAKEKVDAKKTRLVELLDAKLDKVEKRNLHLVEMMEQMVKEKETHSRRMNEATKNMEELGRKLAGSEKVNTELRSVNAQLKTMLENMEGKGTKIAQLAKEKVQKYKDENVKMQQQLDQMKVDAADAQNASTNSELLTTVENAEVLHRKLTSELQCAIDEANPTVEGHCEALSSLARTCAELEQVLQTVRHDAETATATVVHQVADHTHADSATIADLERQNKDLREAKDREVTSLSNEVQRLKAAIGQLVGIGAAT